MLIGGRGTHPNFGMHDWCEIKYETQKHRNITEKSGTKSKSYYDRGSEKQKSYKNGGQKDLTSFQGGGG